MKQTRIHNLGRFHGLLFLAFSLISLFNLLTALAGDIPSPLLSTLTVQPDQATMTVTQAGGRRFRVESRSNLDADATWVAVTRSIRDSGTNNLVSVPAPRRLNRFYRVRNDTGENVGGSVFDPTRVASIHLTVGTSNLHWMYATLGTNGGVADSVYVPCTLVFDLTNTVTQVGIRFKGNASFNRTGSDDPYYKPYKIDFDRFVEDQQFRGLKKLNLHVANSTTNNTALNEHICYGALQDFGIPAPRTGWADVWLDGKFLGLYTTVEQVDAQFLSRIFEDKNGNLYKPELPDGGLGWRGRDFSSYTNVHFERGPDNLHTDFLRLVDIINHQPPARFAEVLDVDSVLMYHAANIALANWDNYSTLGHNYYLYLASPGRFFMIPWDVNESLGISTNIWDSVISLGNLTTNSVPPGLGTNQPLAGGNNGIPGGLTFGDTNRPMTMKLLAGEPYRERYLHLLEAFLDGPGSEESIVHRSKAVQITLSNRVDAAEMQAIQNNTSLRVQALKRNVAKALQMYSKNGQR